MERKDNIRLKIIITILLGCMAIFAFFYSLQMIQDRMATDQIRKEMIRDTENLMDDYSVAEEKYAGIKRALDTVYEDNMILLIRMMADEPAVDNLDEYLKQENTFFEYPDIMIADKAGNIIASANGRYKDLKDEQYDPLREVFESEETEMARLDSLTESDAWFMKKKIGTLEDIKDEDLEAIGFYAFRMDEEKELVLAVDQWNDLLCTMQLDPWTVLLQNEIISEQGYVFVWSDDEEKILYYPDDEFRYQSVEKLGMDMGKIEDGGFGWNQIDGQEMYLYTVHEKEQGIWIACAVSRSSLISSGRITTLIQWVLFSLLAASLVYYVTLLLRQNKIKVLTDFTESGKVYAYQSRQHKLFIITILLSLIMALMVFYLQTLYLMSTWANASARQTQRIEETVEDNERTAAFFTRLYDGYKTSQIRAFSDFISRNEEMKTTSMLDDYSYILQVSDIQVLSKNGKSIAGVSNMAYPAVFNEAAMDESLSYAQVVASQDEGRETCDWMIDGRMMLVPMTDSESSVSGYLYVNYYSLDVDVALLNLSLYGTLEMVRPGKNGFVFSVNLEKKTFFYHPETEKRGRDALTYGLTENQIKDNYSNFITLDNIVYYATTDVIGEEVIFYVVPKTELLKQRLWLAIFAVAIAFILFLFIGIFLYTSRTQIEMTAPDEERRDDNNDHESAEYRMMRMLMYFVAAAAAVFIVYSGLRAEYNTEGILGYVMVGGWEAGFNVFALTASIIILCKGGIVLLIVSKLIGMLGNILPVRGGTILKMMGSLFVYIGIAFLIYQCMLCFGLNPTTLMASAGIVSVVIGIGANSLVGDVLAGIFLLMEGDVQVGDVVQIGDFRGYVMELGVRMSKLFDMDTHDIKIIPNNEVRNVVHMTMRMAIVYSDFQICYEEKLGNIEKILKEELERVQNKSPMILEGPRYIGVAELGDSGVALRVETKCHESCRKSVEREVNHIVYTIFQSNNIGVPYPQVTVHQGNDETVEREFPEDNT